MPARAEPSFAVRAAHRVGVAAVAASLVSSRIMRPLGRVGETTRRLAAGDYEQRVPISVETELAELANDVNTLAATLQPPSSGAPWLISDVAHELRTPLTTIQGSMEGLIDGVLEPGNEVLGSVADEAARLMRVVGDLSTLSRLAEGAMELRLALVDPAEEARGVALRLRPQFRDKGVAWRWRRHRGSRPATPIVWPRSSPTSSATPSPTPRPGGSVGVRTHNEGRDRVTVVADTGEGIPPADLERIFERFYRTGSGEGLGMGHRAHHRPRHERAHGGHLTARSPGAGGGAEFVVRLPLSS